MSREVRVLQEVRVDAGELGDRLEKTPVSIRNVVVSNLTRCGTSGYEERGDGVARLFEAARNLLVLTDEMIGLCAELEHFDGG